MSGPELTSRVWKDGQLVAESVPLDTLAEVLADPTTLSWYDLSDPDPRAVQQLAAELDLDFHSVEDALTPGERPKAMRYPDHLFCTVYTSGIGETGDPNTRLVVRRVSVWVFAHGVVTVHRETAEESQALHDRLRNNPELLTNGPLGILHALLDLVVDEHFETVQHLDDVVEHIEDDLFDETLSTQETQRQVYRLRKELVQFRRIVLPMREVVSAVTRPSSHGLSVPRDLEPYFNDLHDHTLRVAEWTDSLRDLVSTIFETNLSIQDAKLNVVMKKLAGWAAIIAVPTLITGWFGQNIPFPGDGQPAGLVASVGLIVVSTALLYAVFRHNDWI